jgi:hypothetical protein
MFQFPSLPRAPYVFRYASQRITTGGFPHSEISGSKVGQHLTRAYRSRPRPSSALGAKASTVCPCSLDREELIIRSYGVFKVHASSCPPSMKGRARGPVSQNSTANDFIDRGRLDLEVNVDLGEPDHGRTNCVHRQAWRPPVVIATGIPRKEVIQPQLPLRLPCYDFTPIIDPTFDGCLPCGLAHRLRVLPTFVV